MLRALLLAVVIALAAPAAAPAKSPWRWPSTSVTLNTAYVSALAEWGATPCRGAVKIRWGVLPDRVDAEATWLRDLRAPNDPGGYEGCRVVVSSGLRSAPWAKVCTIVTHEVGHLLTGAEHSTDPADVMHPWYVVPTARCAGRVAPVAGNADTARVPERKDLS